MFWRRIVARRQAEQMSVAGSMLEEIANADESSLPLDERLAILARLRESALESPAVVDRFLVERITRLQEALSTVQEQHGELRVLIKSLTAPSLFSGRVPGHSEHIRSAWGAGADRKRAARCADGRRSRAGATRAGGRGVPQPRTELRGRQVLKPKLPYRRGGYLQPQHRRWPACSALSRRRVCSPGQGRIA